MANSIKDNQHKTSKEKFTYLNSINLAPVEAENEYKKPFLLKLKKAKEEINKNHN